jgi:hypothetical protein
MSAIEGLPRRDQVNFKDGWCAFPIHILPNPMTATIIDTVHSSLAGKGSIRRWFP